MKVFATGDLAQSFTTSVLGQGEMKATENTIAYIVITSLHGRHTRRLLAA
jgi:hypothetical protein